LFSDRSLLAAESLEHFYEHTAHVRVLGFEWRWQWTGHISFHEERVKKTCHLTLF